MQGKPPSPKSHFLCLVRGPSGLGVRQVVGNLRGENEHMSSSDRFPLKPKEYKQTFESKWKVTKAFFVFYGL